VISLRSSGGETGSFSCLHDSNSRISAVLYSEVKLVLSKEKMVASPRMFCNII
jgi:hypothetical protein